MILKLQINKLKMVKKMRTLKFLNHYMNLNLSQSIVAN